MKKIFLAIALLAGSLLQAQQFINSGMIEFQVVKNNHKMIGDEGIFAEQFKTQIPKLSTTYFQYTFADNKAIYKFDRKDAATAIQWGRESEDEIWYSDYSSNTGTNYKYVVDNYYLMNGALMDVEWKLSPNETRVIAGFNCRKATAVIFDSVYVFAFYTDEITVSGGPMGIHGLPGMVLGVTIPRMFSSWVATKLSLAGADTKKIVAPVKGKKKELSELIKVIKDVSKNWGPWGQQVLWQTML